MNSHRTAPGRHFQPGDKLFLVVSRDILRDRVDVRHTTVLDQSPQALVVRQPETPLPKSHLGKTVEVAYFPEAKPAEATCLMPLGYDARVLRFHAGYRDPKGGRSVPALSLTPPVEVWRETSIRMQVRAPVKPEHELTVSIPGAEGALLLDISGGGALLSLPARKAQKGGQLQLALVFPDGDLLELCAEIRWTANDPSLRGHRVAGVQFQRLAIPVARFLARLAQQLLNPTPGPVKALGSQRTMPWPTTFKCHGR